MNQTRQDLLKLYKDFCGYICETNPKYTNNDFTFDNFMQWLSIEEDDIRNER